MGFLQASFGGATFKNVEGYRISVSYSPNDGCKGNFYVYIWDRMEAGTPFESGIDMGPEGKTRSGTLEVADAERSYKFEDIELVGAEIGVTRRQRYRLLEFKFDKHVVDTKSVTLTNSSKAKLKKAGLDEDYMFSLGGASEQLLGFRAKVAGEEATVVRFSALRNAENSFLQKVVELNTAQQPNKAMPTFTVTFSQGDLEVSTESLSRMYVDESYGELRTIPIPSLSALVAERVDSEVHRLRLEDFTSEALLEHDLSHRFVSGQLDPKTVETATFIFNTGYQRQLKIK